MNRSGCALFLALAACASPRPATRPDPIPGEADPKRADSRIVAFLDGAPITWREVAERVLELERRRSIDLFLRWKILESARERLGIGNTPEDLERRADAMIAQYRKSQGDDLFRKQLEEQGFTEVSYRSFVLQNRLFVEKLTLEKMVRYSYVTEGWVEIDRHLFSDEADAERFVAEAGGKGYDTAADSLKDQKGRVVRRPREIFIRDLPPSDLEPATVERMFQLSSGALGGVERNRSGLFCVYLVRKRSPADSATYESVRQRVFEWILEDPPADSELAGWIDLQLKRSKIEYADRGSQGN